MRCLSVKAILGTAALALLGGCATTIEMGPGYYHYDTGLAGASAPATPAVVYQEPAVVYREPTVVYRNPAVIYREPTVVYRPARDAFRYSEHGQ